MTVEREEKKYCKSCENQRRHFTSFVVSTDGMFGFQEACKVAHRRMGEDLFNSKEFH